jgi:hypothetical protein
MITAGSKGQGSTAASHYIIDVSPENESPWHVLPIPEDASKVAAINPAKLSPGTGSGIFSLYQRADGGTTALVELLDPSTNAQVGNIRMLTASLGNINGIYSNHNPWE